MIFCIILDNKAIQLNQKYADAYYNRGLTHYADGVPVRACEDFYLAGILYLSQGKLKDILRCVQIIKKVDPNSEFIKKLIDETGRSKKIIRNG